MTSLPVRDGQLSFEYQLRSVLPNYRHVSRRSASLRSTDKTGHDETSAQEIPFKRRLKSSRSSTNLGLTPAYRIPKPIHSTNPMLTEL